MPLPTVCGKIILHDYTKNMTFGNWVKSRAQAANRFFAKTGQHLKAGVGFLNNTVLPTASKVHRTITNVSNELQSDRNVSAKNKERLKSLTKLGDVGLQRLKDTTETVNRVHAVL